MGVNVFFVFTSCVIQSLAVAYKDRKYIDRKKFIIMLALAGVGTPLGMIITDYLDVNIANYLYCFFQQ